MRIDDDLGHVGPFFLEELKPRLQSVMAQPISGSDPFASITSLNVVPFPLCHLEFHPFSRELFSTQRDMIDLHKQYHIHLSLIICDEMAKYKSSVHGQISAWLESVHCRRNQHCMVIQMSSENLNANIMNTRSRPISRADLVFEQISTDFGGNRNNHIVQLRLRDCDDASWNEAISILADAIYHSFWSHLASLKEDASRLEAQRTFPGWNFCSFFIAKESIPLSFIDAQLWTKARDAYEELWVDFIGYVYGDSAESKPEWTICAGNLDIELLRKCNTCGQTGQLQSMRTEIAKGRLSLFQFFVYLFCRIACLYELLQDPCALLRKSIHLLEYVDNKASGALAWKFDFIVLVLYNAQVIYDKIKDPPMDTIQNYSAIKSRLYMSLKLILDHNIAVLDHSFLPGTALGLQQPFFQSIIKPSTIEFDCHVSFEELVNDKQKFLSIYTTIAKYISETSKNNDLSCLDLAFIHLLQGDYANSLLIISELLECLPLSKWPMIRRHLLNIRSACAQKKGDYQLALNDLLTLWTLNCKSMSTMIPSFTSRFLEISRSSPTKITSNLESVFHLELLESIPCDSGISDQVRMQIESYFDEEISLEAVSIIFIGGPTELHFQKLSLPISPRMKQEHIFTCTTVCNLLQLATNLF